MANSRGSQSLSALFDPARQPTAPPVAGPPTHTAAPAQVLSRRHTHVRDAVVLSSGGVAAGSLSSILEQPWLTAPAGGLIATGVAVGVLGHRTRARNDLEDRLAEALAPILLGVKGRIDWRIIRLRLWTQGWPGQPRRITLRYAPGINAEDPDWRTELLTAISARLGGSYKITINNPKKGILKLRFAEPVAPEKPAPVAQQRATKALERQLPTSTVTGAELDDTGALTAINVSHQIPDKIANSGYRRRLEGVMTSMHEGRWRGVWNLTGDTVRFEQRPVMPTCIWTPSESRVTGDTLANYRQVYVPYAQDEDGKEMRWYPAKLPHWLLTGSTGSGKTSTLNGIINMLADAGWAVWLGDPKQVEFMGFRNYPNVQMVATKIWEIAAMIRRAREVMDARYELITTGQATEEQFEPLVLVIDELTEFITRLTAWYKSIKATGQPSTCPTLEDLASLFRLGRKGRVHIVSAMQRPDARFLDGENKDNVRMRTSFGRLSPVGAGMMWENMSIGVALPMLPQRGMSTSDDGPVEIQAYRFPDLDTTDAQQQQLLTQLRPKQALHERFLFVPPQPREGEKQEFLFGDYLSADLVPAAERPDLDPLELAKHVKPIDPAILASPTQLLGLGTTTTGAADPATVVEADPSNVGVDDDYIATDPSDPYSGYGTETLVMPLEVKIGDLLENEGTWVVIEVEPEPDIEEPDLIALSWRSDTDDAGTTAVNDGEPVLIRRPIEPEETR